MKTKLMKTSIRGASVALLVSAALLLVLVSGSQGSGQRSSVGGFECSDATIRGTWGIQMQGTAPVPPPLGGGIQNVVGVVTRTYDGMGNFTQIDNIHGSVTGWVPNRPGSGTYQVNPDCTFATHVVSGPVAPFTEERRVIVELVKELRTLTVTPMTSMVSTHSQRIDRR